MDLFGHYFFHIVHFIFLVISCDSHFLRFRDVEGDTLNKDEECHSAGFFGSTTDCTIFYRCVSRPSARRNFDKYSFECPPGLIFDKSFSGCNRVNAVQPTPPCMQNKTESSPQSVNYPHNLLITGSKFGLVHFQYNSSETANYEDIESLELHNILVDPFILTNFLALTTNLQKLILRDVQLLSDFEDQVSLPFLREFYISHLNIIKIPSIGPFQFQANESSVLEDYKSYRAMFRSLIFFYKEKSWDWKIDNISQLKTDIEVVLYGTQIFKMNWREGHVRSRLNFSDDIISNWSPPGSGITPLKNLTLKECPLNVLTAPTRLEVVDFEGVTYGNGTASDVLRKNKELNFIRLWFSPNFAVPNKVYLSDITKQIEILQIGYGMIIKTETNPSNPIPAGSFDRHVEFLHLDTLAFYKCQFEDGTENDFSTTFKTRNVWIVLAPENKQYAILSSILKRNEKLESIGMRNFGRNPNPQPSNYADIEMFLTSAGVLEKQNDFVLEKKGGVWTGRFPTQMDQIF